MTTSPKLDYYFFPSCPFCQRVGAVIDELGVKVTFRNIMESSEDLDTLVRDTGRRTVPCLYVDGKPMHESSDIIAWLQENAENLPKN